MVLFRETTDQQRPEDPHHHPRSPYKCNTTDPTYSYTFNSNGYQRTQPLSSSSLYNIQANTHNLRQPFSSVSVSPSSSCTSPLLSPNTSLLTSFPSPPVSPEASYHRHTPTQAMSPNNMNRNHPDENSILMENLLKLLQFSN